MDEKTLNKQINKFFKDKEHLNIEERELLEDLLNPTKTTLERMDIFLRLSDVFLYAKKTYYGKKWSVVVVGKQEKSLEIIRHNGVKIAIEPDGNNNITLKWPYVKQPNPNDYKTLEIQEDGNYLLVHKAQVKLTPSVTKVRSYIGRATHDEQGNLQPEVPIAVFDWEGKVQKTFHGTTAGTDPAGTCTVTVNLNLGEMLQRMTTFGYNEFNLKKGDILKRYCVDQSGNDLELEPNSNYRQVIYQNLPLK